MATTASKKEVKTGSSNIFVALKDAILLADKEKKKTDAGLSPKAESLLRGLAEDDSMAKFELGTFFSERYNKRKINSDKLQATYWLKESANQGNILALYMLADNYSISMLSSSASKDIQMHFKCTKNEADIVSVLVLVHMILEIENNLKRNTQIPEDQRQYIVPGLIKMKQLIPKNPVCHYSLSGELVLNKEKLPKLKFVDVYNWLGSDVPKKEDFRESVFDSEQDPEKPMLTLNQLCRFVTLKAKEKNFPPLEVSKDNRREVELLNERIASQQIDINELGKQLAEAKEVIGKLREESNHYATSESGDDLTRSDQQTANIATPGRRNSQVFFPTPPPVAPMIINNSDKNKVDDNKHENDKGKIITP